MMADNDIIKINTDIKLTDSNGNSIPVVTPQPEYMVETFSFNSSTNNKPEIITGDE